MILLNLNSEIPFGKYKGAPVEAIIDADFKYACWLFRETQCSPSTEVNDAMDKIKIERQSIIASKSSIGTGYHYSEPDAWTIGNWELGYDW